MYRFATALSAVLLANTLASAQLIVDTRPHRRIMGSFEVTQFTVDAQIRDQAAQVQVTQTFRNPSAGQLEAEYLFPLPEEATVQDVVLLVDGKELPGKILPKEEARRIYESIVRTKKDPALLEYMDRGLFRTSVFPIPPGQSRTVTMRATYLCRRDREVIQFTYPLSTQKLTAKPIQRLAITVNINGKEAIKNVYSPSHNVSIERPSNTSAKLRFEEHGTIPTTDFRLLYALASGPVGASVLSHHPGGGEDGYFMLLASPAVQSDEKARHQTKTVVLVIDRSGSMDGKKIEQAREALKFVVNNLRDGDLFNIVAYDSQVQPFKPELQRYDEATRTEALRFTENLRAGGSTNINEALQTALAMIRNEERPSYVLFMTDGLPTAGETNELAIANNVKSANKLRARLFAFGVGYDVNARLLDRLSGANSGTSEYVKPDDNLETAISRFYSRISSPVLTRLNIEFAGTDVNRTYPKDLPDLFEGGQLIWVGRYRKPGPTKISITGKVAQQEYRMSLDAELAGVGEGSAYAFVERLWATRRIGNLIDEIDLKGRNQELIDELVGLSKKYGILTPYTSFLADEDAPLTDSQELIRRGSSEMLQLGQLGGSWGVAQRAYKADLSAAAAAPPAGVQLRMAESADQPASRAVADAVRQVGNRTFYRRQNRWVDATLTAAEESKPIEVEQFSDAYFKLAAAYPGESNQYLSFQEETIVKLGDKAYRIVPPK